MHLTVEASGRTVVVDVNPDVALQSLKAQVEQELGLCAGCVRRVVAGDGTDLDDETLRTLPAGAAVRAEVAPADVVWQRLVRDGCVEASEVQPRAQQVLERACSEGHAAAAALFGPVLESLDLHLAMKRATTAAEPTAPVALLRGIVDVAELLHRNGVDMAAHGRLLRKICRSKMPPGVSLAAEIKRLVLMGCPITASSNTGETALHALIAHGRSEKGLRALLEARRELPQPPNLNVGGSLLYCTVFYNTPWAVVPLLDTGCFPIGEAFSQLSTCHSFLLNVLAWWEAKHPHTPPAVPQSFFSTMFGAGLSSSGHGSFVVLFQELLRLGVNPRADPNCLFALHHGLQSNPFRNQANIAEAVRLVVAGGVDPLARVDGRTIFDLRDCPAFTEVLKATGLS